MAEAADRRPTFVFDGDCAFCTTSVRWLQRCAPAPVRVVPWQRADLVRLGLTAEECTEAVQWVDAGVRRSAGALAFAHYLRAARRPWRWAGRLLATGPAQVLARPVYGWVARNRHRLPGGTPACRLEP